MSSRLILLALILVVRPLIAQCGSPGLLGIPDLSISTRVIGNDATFTMNSARAFAPWVGFVDVSMGPTVLPFGTFCFTPSAALLYNAYDGSVPFVGPTGTVSVTRPLLPNLGFLAGIPFFIQTVVIDQAGANSIAISESLEVRLAKPGLFFVEPGTSNPFGGSTAAKIRFKNSLSDSYDWVHTLPSTSAVGGIARDAINERLVVLQADGSVRTLDEDSGSPLANGGAPGVGPGSANGILVDAMTGGLVASWLGTPPNPFGGGANGALRIIDASTLGVLTTIPIPGNPVRMVPIPGTGVVYVLTQSASLIPVDLALGQALPAVVLPATNGAIADVLFANGLLEVLLSGADPTPFGGGTAPALAEIDPTTHTVFPGSPVALPQIGLATALRFGSGPAGPALLVLQPQQGLIHALTPGTFAPLGQVGVPVGSSKMELSAGGGEWLVVKSGQGPSPFGGGTPGTLAIIHAASLTLGAMHALPSEAQGHLIVQPSDHLRRAYITSGANVLLGLDTDPPLPAGPMPIAAPTTLAPTAAIAR